MAVIASIEILNGCRSPKLCPVVKSKPAHFPQRSRLLSLLPMFRFSRLWFGTLPRCFHSRPGLLLENLGLRQQAHRAETQALQAKAQSSFISGSPRGSD